MCPAATPPPFESFVEYCDGEELVSLIHLAIHAKSQDVLISAKASVSLTTLSVSADSPEEGDEEVRINADFASRYDSMDDALKKLDKKLYHVLKLNVKGPSHDIIVHSQRSFVQAFIMLYTEHGATNMLRKTGLISKLFGQLFKGDINKFKQECQTKPTKADQDLPKPTKAYQAHQNVTQKLPQLTKTYQNR